MKLQLSPVHRTRSNLLFHTTQSELHSTSLNTTYTNICTYTHIYETPLLICRQHDAAVPPLVCHYHSQSHKGIMTRKQTGVVIQFNVTQTVRLTPLRFIIKLKHVLTF